MSKQPKEPKLDPSRASRFCWQEPDQVRWKPAGTPLKLPKRRPKPDTDDVVEKP
jgi:hypothetical protein